MEPRGRRPAGGSPGVLGLARMLESLADPERLLVGPGDKGRWKAWSRPSIPAPRTPSPGPRPRRRSSLAAALLGAHRFQVKGPLRPRPRFLVGSDALEQKRRRARAGPALPVCKELRRRKMRQPRLPLSIETAVLHGGNFMKVRWADKRQRRALIKAQRKLQAPGPCAPRTLPGDRLPPPAPRPAAAGGDRDT